MIVADTNVWSEPLRREPSPVVLGWLLEHQAEIGITTITVSELRYGALRLPEGSRRHGLLAAIGDLQQQSDDRLLAFDLAAAVSAAELRWRRERAGRPVSSEDLMIAAIAHARGARVATRNVKDFEGFGVEVVNPWQG